MRAFVSDDFDANPLRRDHAVKHLLVGRAELFDSFGRGRARIVVNFLWGAEFVTYRPQVVGDRRVGQHFPDHFRTREEQGLEFMHLNVGQESSPVEFGAHLIRDILQDRFLYGGRLFA